MTKFKIGQQLCVAKATKVAIGNSSSSAKIPLNPGAVVCVTGINEKSITVAFGTQFRNWSPAGGFDMQTIMLGRIALTEAGNLMDVLSTDMQERNALKEIVEKSL
jgi:hypothetical protein